MDTSQDFEQSQGSVVRWVASQSTNPALQALMREAERDRRTRPSTPVHEHTSWTYPLTSTTSFTSIPTFSSSVWHSSDLNSPDVPPLSGSSSSSCPSSLAPRATEPFVLGRAAASRKPLASSTSSANRPPQAHHSTRPRSSSHSTAKFNVSTSKEKYNPRDDEPEALHFIELLKQMSKTVDDNSIKKQQAARAEKEKKREQFLGKNVIDKRSGLDSTARPLTKTASASAVYPVSSSTRASEKTLTTSVSAHKPESGGRKLEKEPSFGVPGVGLVTGKSNPTSLPSLNLNYDPKVAPAPWLPAGGSSHIPTANQTSACGHGFPPPNGGDSPMQDVIDLSETDMECQRPMSRPISRADTAMCMESDSEESDTGMDVSFYKPDPPSRPRVRPPAPKPKPQPSTASRPPVPTQRARMGPPPLGMRRAPQLQSSQFGSTQGTKGVTVPRFKPPLLSNAAAQTSKSGSGSKPVTTGSPRPPPRGTVTMAQTAETLARTTRDPDSSFDVSFDVDPDALEEAMKPYD